MGGLAKGAKKIGGSIGKGIKSLVDESMRPFKRALSTATKPFKPKIPKAGDPPLMPDLELIAKGRRRKRASQMGRSETIMTDALG